MGVVPASRPSLLGALLIAVSFAALTNTIKADQIVIVTTTLEATSCVPVQTVNALGFVLLLVLILAAAIAIFLIRLYRRTKF